MLAALGSACRRLEALTDDAVRRELYNIANDLAEANDVAKHRPDIVAKLSTHLDGWKASLPTEPPAEFLAQRRKVGAPPT